MDGHCCDKWRFFLCSTNRGNWQGVRLFLVSRCRFCGIEVAEVSFLVSRSLFWYRDSVFCCSIFISSSSWDQFVCAFLGLDIL